MAFHTHWRCAAFFVTALSAATSAHATEGGGSIYPIGADSLAPGILPQKVGTYWYHYSQYYNADTSRDANGNVRSIPNFNLQVAANAERVIVVTDKKILGGNLVLQGIVPWVDVKLRAGLVNQERFSVGDVSLGAIILWKGHRLNGWLGTVEYAPTGRYDPLKTANAGRNYWAVSIHSGISYLITSKIDIGVKTYLGHNFRNPATGYRSGDELAFEYMLGFRPTRRLRFGVQGYYYDQIADDRLHGLTLPGGDRGKAFAIGPAVGVTFGKSIVGIKLQQETMAENRPKGSRFWLQWMVPLG